MTITAKDMEQGFKRVNICLNIKAAEKLVKLSQLKNLRHTTLSTVYLIEVIDRDYKKCEKSIDEMNQTDLFHTKKGEKKSVKNSLSKHEK